MCLHAGMHNLLCVFVCVSLSGLFLTACCLLVNSFLHEPLPIMMNLFLRIYECVCVCLLHLFAGCQVTWASKWVPPLFFLLASSSHFIFISFWDFYPSPFPLSHTVPPSLLPPTIVIICLQLYIFSKLALLETIFIHILSLQLGLSPIFYITDT